MNSFSQIAFVVLLVLAVLVAAFVRGQGPAARRLSLKKKRFMTPREQAMHHRLSAALPWAVICPQVSFSALMTARQWQDRNRFNRKVAGFVVCSRTLVPIAVVELDDVSHKDKQDEDEIRDAMLQLAGYQVIRYANVPDIDRLRQDIPEPLFAAREDPPGASAVPSSGSATRREAAARSKRQP